MQGHLLSGIYVKLDVDLSSDFNSLFNIREDTTVIPILHHKNNRIFVKHHPSFSRKKVIKHKVL